MPGIQGATGSRDCSTRGRFLTLEPPAKSLGGCIAKPEAEKLQSSYLTGLANVISYAIEDGKLVLYAANKQRMGTMAPLEAVPFEGTTWELMFYPSADAVGRGPGPAWRGDYGAVRRRKTHRQCRLQ